MNVSAAKAESGSKTGSWLIIGAVSIGLVVGVFALTRLGGGGGGEEEDSVTTYRITRENMVVAVTQSGQLEATRKTVLRCEVRERNLEILWLVDEGTEVQPGDVVARIDTTSVEDELLDDEQRLDSAKANLTAKDVSLKNTLSQTKSDVSKAELDYEFAQLALEKYIEGTYPQDQQQAKGDLKLKEERLDRAKDTMEGSQKLLDKGYITANEYKADAAAYESAKLDLEVSRGKLEVLEKFTYYEEKRKLESDVVQKRDALERVKNKAEADVEKARVDLKTAQSDLERRQRRFDETQQNLVNCVIKSPVAGRAVYAPQGGRRWGNDEPLQVGGEAYYGMEMIHIPESGAMSVAITIEESQRDKVKVGMPVRVTLPSMPDREFMGTLVRINEYLNPSGWWNNYEKVYAANVELNGDVSALRTGMNCQTEILVGVYKDVLTVPSQAVMRVKDQYVVYLADNAENPTAVPVKIGLDNGRKVHLLSGIEAGKMVTLIPPLEPSERIDDADDLPDSVTATDGSEVEESEATDSSDQAEAQEDKPEASSGQGQQRRFELNLATLRQFKDSGMMDRLNLDADLIDKINDCVDNNKEPSEELKAELMKAFRKMREQMQNRNNTGDEDSDDEDDESGS